MIQWLGVGEAKYINDPAQIPECTPEISWQCDYVGCIQELIWMFANKTGLEIHQTREPVGDYEKTIKWQWYILSPQVRRCNQIYLDPILLALFLSQQWKGLATKYETGR